MTEPDDDARIDRAKVQARQYQDRPVSFTGGYEARGEPCPEYKSHEDVWREFLAWWARNRGDAPLWELHNLAGRLRMDKDTLRGLFFRLPPPDALVSDTLRGQIAETRKKRC